LRYAHDHPDIVVPNTAQGLRRAGAAGVLTAEDAAFLSLAYDRWLGLQGMIRHSMDGVPDDETLPPGLKARLVTNLDGAGDFEGLKAAMADTAARVLALYERLVLGPAEEGETTAPDLNESV
jgi:glutamate-ammonia-ligase adenylyltransferase